MPRKVAVSAPVSPLVFDVGALIAVDRGDRQAWLTYRRALANGQAVVVPTPVLAQAWRGGPGQARLAHMLTGCRVVAPSEALAKQAGILLGRSPTGDAVDAIVVASALALRATIVTSDVGDISLLVGAAESGHDVAVIGI